METIYEDIPIQKTMSGIKIREPEDVVPGPVADIPYSSNKRKKVLEEEQEVYNTNIRAHKPDVTFVNLSKTDMAACFNKASRCLLSNLDMEYLDSMDLVVRKEQAQTALAEGLLRMIFETTKVQQNEVNQETIRTLSSQIDEKNDKIAQMTRESEGHAQVVKKL
ncbi:uncharacterized protein LOC130812549 [Amaranthus tricolor]|uniref:uncharacterized protein LOC130812549 n=1 Tax=Amaranthus tricolor TaxID=29722 RepID=UPI00258FA7BC|nr:uncharacterized protein LOC130812549 [Amaranthus tricolor]